MCCEPDLFITSLSPLAQKEVSMTRVDLITGFLGAGKTTFIKKYIEHLKAAGEKVLVIENEFGMVNVDAKILREANCEVGDLTGCCMCCTGKEKFKELLIMGADKGYDRIVVEPSGIYDVDEFFNVLGSAEVSAKCTIGSIITILDACNAIPDTNEGKYLLFCQILSSGTVLISKTDLPGAKGRDGLISSLKGLFAEFKSAFDETIIHPNAMCDFSEGDYVKVSNAGYHIAPHLKENMVHDEIFGVCEIMAKCNDEQDLKDRLHRLFTTMSCGKIMRIKGSVMFPDKSFHMVNATGSVADIDEADGKKGLLVVIGQELDRGEINKAWGL